MNVAITIARYLLGLVFTVFGLNFFFNFLPPPDLGERAMSLFGALAGSGYLMQVEKLVEIVAGVLLLAGRYVPLALTLLAPLVVNIVLFHAFLAPGGLPVAILVLVLELFLAWAYRDAFQGVLQASARPRLGAPSA
ncbi:MAG TPA: DoxX family membrane protein [Gemmatimonadales bacterium]|nr:DoxX family membrane protein [Gemmatimonadales bacterium]